MKRKTSRSVAIDCRLIANFARVREKLLCQQFAERLDRPLAYWALPSDRRLPLALIDHSLRKLLAMPFDELYETPGIGPKKLASLVCLLERVALADSPAAEPSFANGALSGPIRGEEGPSSPPGEGDMANVSEALWTRWRETIRRSGLCHETLGRFAASLQDLPRVLWRAPLGVYAKLSLAEIRSLKAHGEKRVGAVLAIFGNLHGIFSQMEACRHLTARIVPTFAAQIESWFAAGPKLGSWTAAELRDSWIVALLEQLRMDAGEPVVRLVECRLHPNSQSVQQTARRLGLTRGRVYETLADVETILAIRWPEGRSLADRLAGELKAHSDDPDAIALLDSARQNFFPERQEVPAAVPIFAGILSGGPESGLREDFVRGLRGNAGAQLASAGRS
ncbi:MAG TPA: hypothetical protein VND64_37390 [Pirellulales bacterium]|nr:hypothetical protein [Pirellulales bacterium]